MIRLTLLKLIAQDDFAITPRAKNGRFTRAPAIDPAMAWAVVLGLVAAIEALLLITQPSYARVKETSGKWPCFSSAGLPTNQKHQASSSVTETTVIVGPPDFS